MYTKVLLATKRKKGYSRVMGKSEGKFVIEGGKALKGEIEVLGSKNATTPMIAASILFEEPITLENVPLVEDVFRMVDILKSMGATIEWLSKRTLLLHTKELKPQQIDQTLVASLRSSVLFIGPLLARFGFCELTQPGGCVIGARPLDTHFKAFEDLGVTIHKTRKNGCDVFMFDAKYIHGGKIILEEFSVTATENILLLASRMSEGVEVRLAASEPHVQDLMYFCEKAGVTIKREGDHAFLLKGKKHLLPLTHRVISDYIEAGTFLILSRLYGDAIKIKNIPTDYIDVVIKKLDDAKEGKATNIQTLPYPGFPTDLQAPFGLLATQLKGRSLIQDTLYENRFGYLRELQKMGAEFEPLNHHEVAIKGPIALRGATIESFDLRAGITLIMAGLIAKGTTTIHNAYQVDRGYERIEERLQKLGAKIKRVSL